MKEIRLSRRQLLKGAGAVGVLGALGIPTTVFADGTRVQWNIMKIDFTTVPPTVRAGGMLSPQAISFVTSTITFTGSGTFHPGGEGGVTGGGTWKTSDSTGTQTGIGTYKVTGFVSWAPAPGKLPATWNDTLGNHADQSAGVAVLRIRYSDQSQGVLTISCNLDDPSTEAVFEGVTATKNFVDYWSREANADGRATLFHVLSESSGD
jgi:TAT (twin-arginine translocation) pathway signal sequence